MDNRLRGSVNKFDVETKREQNQKMLTSLISYLDRKPLNGPNEMLLNIGAITLLDDIYLVCQLTTSDKTVHRKPSISLSHTQTHIFFKRNI